MSDSDELLFCDITDAEDDGSNSLPSNDGTAYPRKFTRVAGVNRDDDSGSSSETYTPPPSQSGDLSQRASRSLSKLKKKRSRRSSFQKLQSTTNTEFYPGENDQTQNEDDLKPPYSSSITHHESSTTSTTTGSKVFNHKKRRFLHGLSRPNHHALSNRDSSSSESDEMVDVDLDIMASPQMTPQDLESLAPFAVDAPSQDASCWKSPLKILQTLYQNGHLLSILLTVSVLIAGAGCITRHIAAYITVSVLYALYLLECALNKKWKELAAEQRETANATERNLVVWVNGKSEECSKLKAIGFETKCCEWDRSVIEFVANKDRQRQIAAIVVPPGYEGDRIRQSMMEKWDRSISRRVDIDDKEEDEGDLSEYEHSGDLGSEHGRNKESEEARSLSEQSSFDGVSPVFVVWEGDWDELMAQLVAKKVVMTEREKMVTHSESTVYPYNSWKDLSPKYPLFENYVMTSLTVDKSYCFGNAATKRDYIEKKKQFMEQNDFDEFQSLTEKVGILGFTRNLMIKHCDSVTGEMEKTPFWSTVTGYWLWSLCLCSAFPRYKVSRLYGRESWKIIKTISI